MVDFKRCFKKKKSVIQKNYNNLKSINKEY